MSILTDISENLQRGKAKVVKELVQQAVDEGISAKQILEEGLLSGMSVIGEKFKNNEVFVPEVLVAARAMNMGVAVIKPLLASNEVQAKGRACIGTVKGDLHDIGKNLVKLMLEGKGLEVVDLGTDVAPEAFVKAAQEQHCGLICLSALLTTTMGVMGDVVKAAQKAGIRDQVKLWWAARPSPRVSAMKSAPTPIRLTRPARRTRPWNSALDDNENNMSIPCILTVVLDGKTAVQQAAHGVLLWDALRQSGYALSAPCGGHGKCGKCRVRAEGALSPRPDADGFCLACQTHLAGDATVWLDRPSVLSNIEGAGKMPEFSLNPPPGKYGLALDIGTTTLAAQLLSLKDGRILAAVTAENPQRQIAHDVIGRIQAAMDGQGLALQAQIRGEIDRMRRALCVQTGLPETAIDFSVYTGNTTMLYLLTGRNPKPLSAAPFEADCLFDYESDAIYFPPCVGSYVARISAARYWPATWSTGTARPC